MSSDLSNLKNCERCNKETNTFIMSMFNTQMICIDCKDKEKKNPRYELARFVEFEEVNAGDKWYNPQTETFEHYKYTNIYFIKFVKEVDSSIKDILL